MTESLWNIYDKVHCKKTHNNTLKTNYLHQSSQTVLKPSNGIGYFRQIKALNYIYNVITL